MLRFDKVVQPQGIVSSRVGYTVVLDNAGLYLIQTGSGTLPEGYQLNTASGIAGIIAKPLINLIAKRMTEKCIKEMNAVEQRINEQGHQNFPLGKRGALIKFDEIESIAYSVDGFDSAVINLKTAKNKFALNFYKQFHDKAAVQDLAARLQKSA